MIPWYYKYGAYGLLIAIVALFAWTKGANHVQDKWDAQNARNEEQAKKIEAIQKLKAEQSNNEAKSLLARNDAYWRMRIKSVQANSAAGSAGGIDEASTADSSNPPGSVGCNPQDGSADAIIILQWQKFYEELRSASLPK